MGSTETQNEIFVTPDAAAKLTAARMESPRGPLLVASCRSGSYLSERVTQRYQALLTACGSSGHVLHVPEVDFEFANSETCARLEVPVSDKDVYLIQALCDPVSGRSADQNYMALLMAARALRENGARHVTAILPYLAYGRQDKPTDFRREPTTARLMADLALAAGIDRLVAWHPHCGQLRGFYGSNPVHMLSPLTLLIEHFRRFRGQSDTILVAPDAGASELVTNCGRALGLECAIGSKHRPRPDESSITQVIGDFRGKRTAIVLDDEIGTGGTVYNLIRKLADDHGITEVLLAASHHRCVSQWAPRLEELHQRFGLRELTVTNSIPQTPGFTSLPYVVVKCLSDALARAINRIHYGRSVSEVFYRP
jgi:ribose-phosphate pyrophosphokinase